MLHVKVMFCKNIIPLCKVYYSKSVQVYNVVTCRITYNIKGSLYCLGIYIFTCNNQGKLIIELFIKRLLYCLGITCTYSYM